MILWQNPKKTPGLSPSHSLATERVFLSSFFSQPNPVPPSSASIPTPPARRWVGRCRWIRLRSQPTSPRQPSRRERARPTVDSPPNRLTLKGWKGPSERVPSKATRALGPMNLHRTSRLGAPILLENPLARRALPNWNIRCCTNPLKKNPPIYGPLLGENLARRPKVEKTSPHSQQSEMHEGRKGRPKKDLSHETALTVCNFSLGYVSGSTLFGPFFWSWKIFDSWALSFFHQLSILAAFGGSLGQQRRAVLVWQILLEMANNCAPTTGCLEYLQSMQLETPSIFLKLIH